MTITFAATCTRGHHARYAFTTRKLRAHLERGTLLLKCRKCDNHRPPTDAETLMLTQMVISSEARDEAAAK